MKHDVEMTFGEHLEELRRRIVYALIGLAVASIACGLFHTRLFNALAMPFEDASRKLADRLEAEHLESLGPNPPQPVQWPEDLQEEIRRLRHPRMIPESPTGLFTTIIIICVAAGFIIASPWVAYQIWAFVGVGLHPKERRFVYTYGPVSLVLFFVGAGFSFFVLRYAFQALMGIGTGMRVIEHTYTLAGYLTFLMWMSIAFGLSFETPLVVLFLARTGIVEVRTLFRQQRLVIMVFVVMAAVFSPGQDPFTMIAMGIPMILLYEVGVLLAWVTVRKKRREEAAQQDEGDPWDELLSDAAPEKPSAPATEAPAAETGAEATSAAEQPGGTSEPSPDEDPYREYADEAQPPAEDQGDSAETGEPAPGPAADQPPAQADQAPEEPSTDASPPPDYDAGIEPEERMK